MWGHIEAGEVRIGSGDAFATLIHPGGAGGLTIEGLKPGSSNRLRVQAPGIDTTIRCQTPPTPPGELLAKIATVSDLHLIEKSWGALKTMRETEPDLEPYALRCARAAIAEAQEWGAAHLVIKGDAAHHRSPESFGYLSDLVDDFADLPMSLLIGNHDMDRTSQEPLPDSIGKRYLRYTNDVDSLDVGGVRLIGVNTTIANHNNGTIEEHTSAVADSVNPETPNMFFLHHHLQRRRWPTYWPMGVPGPEANRFLEAVGRRTGRGLVTSGHSHRNRTRLYPGVNGPLPVTEVASTKDWPGVWAAYSVYEGGIRQVIRRVESPAAARWHEFSRYAVLGLWSAWAPGSLSERCFSHEWRSKP